MRTHINDAGRHSSRSGCTQCGLGFGDDMKRRDDIDLMQLAPYVRSSSRHIGMGNHTADSGIVHDDVQTPPFRDSFLHQPYPVCIFSQVCLHISRRTQLPRHGESRFHGIARMQNDGIAIPGQSAGYRLPNT